jgi:hypothetical protein
MNFDPLECRYCEHPPMKSDLILRIDKLGAYMSSYAMTLLYVSTNH